MAENNGVTCYGLEWHGTHSFLHSDAHAVLSEITRLIRATRPPEKDDYRVVKWVNGRRKQTFFAGE